MPKPKSRLIWPAAALGLLLAISFIGYSLTRPPGTEASKPPRYQFYEGLKAEQDNRTDLAETEPLPVTLIAQPLPVPEMTAIEPTEEYSIEDIGEAAQAPDELAKTDETESAAQADSVEEITSLLAAAQESLAAYRLTTPRKESAFHYYQRVLALDPDNPDARQGLAQIATRYVQLTRRAIRSYDYSKARRYATAGLTVAPEHPELLNLQAQARTAPRPAVRNDSASSESGLLGGLRDILSGNARAPAQQPGFNDK
ncbi:MAG: hypothetical protein HC808_02630 [Candidatus Competibacteraceae bacterium]|nr:hypothetical protein [Candidatus Competibacteraceae bacterium]